MIRVRALSLFAATLLLAQLGLAGAALPQSPEPPPAPAGGAVTPAKAKDLRPARRASPKERLANAEPLQILASATLSRGLELDQLPAFLVRRAAAASAAQPAPSTPLPAPPEPAVDQGLRPVGLPDPSGGALAQAWCASIVDPAQEARAAWQAKKIAELEQRLEAQIARLEARRKEYLEWFEKQEEQRRKAEDSVVSIVSRMKPDAAAAQLAVMDESSAASVLSRMNPRTASVILNEMTAAKAARIADVISSVTQAKARAAQGAQK